MVLIGGLLAGITGAIIGGSGRTSTTVETELMSWALVTACRGLKPDGIDSDNVVKFRVQLNANLYQKLQKDYVQPYFETKQRQPQKLVVVDDPGQPMDSLTALVKSRDDGILTDAEVAEKATQLEHYMKRDRIKSEIWFSMQRRLAHLPQ